MDDSKLSLYIDGRLPEEAARELEGRLREEAPLRRRVEELRALQTLAVSLPLAEGTFKANDIREMAADRRASVARWRTLAASIAAVLVLAVSHGAVYLLGANRGANGTETPSASDFIEQAEDFLEGLAGVDPAAPHDRLHAELISYRKQANQNRLASTLEEISRNDWPVADRRRAGQLAAALGEVDLLFRRTDDPGILAMFLARRAREALDGGDLVLGVPENADGMMVVTYDGDGRIRIDRIDTTQGPPRRVLEDLSIEEFRRLEIELSTPLDGD